MKIFSYFSSDVGANSHYVKNVQLHHCCYFLYFYRKGLKIMDKKRIIICHGFLYQSIIQTVWLTCDLWDVQCKNKTGVKTVHTNIHITLTTGTMQREYAMRLSQNTVNQWAEACKCLIIDLVTAYLIHIIKEAWRVEDCQKRLNVCLVTDVKWK